MFYRTDLSNYTETDYPKTAAVKATDELNNYYEKNKDTYQFDQGFLGEASMADDVFSNKSKYSTEFFESNFLLFIILEEGSGSVRHRVENVVPTNGSLSVNITRIIPEIGTADMAQWHIVLELDKSLADLEVAVIVKDEHLTDI